VRTERVPRVCLGLRAKEQIRAARRQRRACHRCAGIPRTLLRPV